MSGEFWFKPNNMPGNWKGWVITIGFGALVVGIAVIFQIGSLPGPWAVVIALVGATIYLPFIVRHKAKTLDEWRRRSSADLV